MEALLRNDFTAQYGLPPISETQNIGITTNLRYFEIEDDSNREIRLHEVAGNGVAKYSNPNSYVVNIINYDKFVTLLFQKFQEKKGRCDLIVYTENKKYFLLNELTDTNPQYVYPHTNSRGNQIGKLAKATGQFIESLKLLFDVDTIKSFVNQHELRECCFFNKQSNAPNPITATTAFNRINTIPSNGFKMSNPDIESFGFELYEYSGTQIYKM